MTNALILGAGMVGSVMAADLASDPAFTVTIADINPRNLEVAARRAGGRVKTLQADLSNAAEVQRLAKQNDIVLGALSSRIGFQTLKAVIEAGRNYCDISFMADDALALDDLAKKHNVTALVDMGVAPGMSNLLAGHAAAVLNPCDNIEIYVGGLPRERRWPFQYKAGFSPADVIEEYVRPSRIVEHGKVVVRQALSEPELMNFDGVGTLEAFNTDGLRSLAYTLSSRELRTERGDNEPLAKYSLSANAGRGVPFMKERTLRYPGHIELMRVFRETGLFSETPIEVKAAGSTATATVRPLDVTSKLLFPKWTYEEGEADLTVMRVLADGMRDGKHVRLIWDVLDFLDPATKFTSMARTTGFPCTIAARMIASGKIQGKGVLAPEHLAIGPRSVPGIVDVLFAELGERGVRYSHHTETR